VVQVKRSSDAGFKKFVPPPVSFGQKVFSKAKMTQNIDQKLNATQAKISTGNFPEGGGKTKKLGHSNAYGCKVSKFTRGGGTTPVKGGKSLQGGGKPCLTGFSTI
jgi:hypothetical protein